MQNYSADRYFTVALLVSIFMHAAVFVVLLIGLQYEPDIQYKELKIRLGQSSLGQGNKELRESLVQLSEALHEFNSGEVITPGAEPEVMQDNIAPPQEVKKNQDSKLSENKDVQKIAPLNKRIAQASLRRVVHKAAANSSPSRYKTGNSDKNALSAGKNVDLAGEEIGNSDSKKASPLQSYEQILPLWLDKFRIYPREARALGLQGRGEVFIKIDRSGKILLSKVTRSTTHHVLDLALVKMIEDANPVIPVPSNYYPNRKTFSYKISFDFTL